MSVPGNQMDDDADKVIPLYGRKGLRSNKNIFTLIYFYFYLPIGMDIHPLQENVYQTKT